jgi:hypothetical protein
MFEEVQKSNKKFSLELTKYIHTAIIYFLILKIETYYLFVSPSIFTTQKNF